MSPTTHFPLATRAAASSSQVSEPRATPTAQGMLTQCVPWGLANPSNCYAVGSAAQVWRPAHSAHPSPAHTETCCTRVCMTPRAAAVDRPEQLRRAAPADAQTVPVSMAATPCCYNTSLQSVAIEVGPTANANTRTASPPPRATVVSPARLSATCMPGARACGPGR